MRSGILNNLLLTPELIFSLGNSNFPKEMLKSLNVMLEVNHISLVHLEDKESATYIFSANDDVVLIDRSFQQLYLSTFYRKDPNMNFIGSDTLDGAQQVTRLLPENIEDLEYRKLWIQKMGVVDRLSILTNADKGLYCLNLFRASKQFTSDDIEKLKQFGPVISSLAVKHTRLTGTLSSFMTRDAQISTLMERLIQVSSKLTDRERQVCARLILGMSSEGIALDLNIKKQSVLTYRRRAYSRLQICSQNELFALCLTSS